MAQEPGPRGSPHVPHDPVSPAGAASPAERPPPLPTAKVEKSFSRSALLHWGHEGRAVPITSASKRREHCRQTYSNSGTDSPSRSRRGSRRKNTGGGGKMKGAMSRPP